MTLIIIVITGIVSYLALQNRVLFEQLCHSPYAEARRGEYYRLVSGGFVHGSMMHFIINMYVLYQFGGIVENVFAQIFGSTMSQLVFAFFYLSAIIVANIGTFFKHKDHPGFRSVGASGVTSALVFMYAMFDPWQMFLFPPVPAVLFAFLYVGYSIWASRQDRDNIDHLAHLYGGLYGVAFLFIVYPESMNIFLSRLLNT